ncbi:MAG: extracellular solute-binding protein [Cyanobacteria bacterium P01_G01_bin.54]
MLAKLKVFWFSLCDRRRMLLILAIVTCILVLLAGLWQKWYREPLYIALMAPTSGISADAGREMEQGTRLYLEQINRQGGVQGHPVKLLVFDDQSSPEVGRQKAQEIVDDERISVALGSWLSSVSIPAGAVYEQAGLAAISGAASSDQLTAQNSTYFQVLPNTQQQGVFIANYLKQILKINQATVISNSQDPFSQRMAQAFIANFQGLGGHLAHQFDLATQAGQPEDKTQAITEQLLQFDESELGTIVLLTLSSNAADIVIQMKRMGVNLPIVGGDGLSSENFLSRLRQTPEGATQPGYFSDGIYVAVALLYDTADEAAQIFRTQFIAAYGQEPTAFGAIAYDAARVAVAALEQSQIAQTKTPSQAKRYAVFQALARMTRPETAVQGLQGKLQFTPNRTVESGWTMGVFSHQKLISAPTQLRYIDDPSTVRDLQSQLKAEKIIYAGGKYGYVTPVIYTGLELNEVSALDIRNETYEIDFLLWFRYPQTLDSKAVENVEFINATQPTVLGEPFHEVVKDGMKVRAFRQKVNFKTSFDFRKYPFDSQQLYLTFRNRVLDRKNLIYIPDIVGMETLENQDINKKTRNSNILDRLTTWSFKNARIFETTDKINSTLGNLELIGSDSGVNYSLFNLVLEIERKWLAFSVNDILPLSCFVWLLYLLLFEPFDKLSPGSLSGILLGVVFFHVGLRLNLPNGVAYVTGLDMVFYVVYGAIVFQTLLFLLASTRKSKQAKTHRTRWVLQWTKRVFPLYFLLAALGIGLHYGLITPKQWWAHSTAPSNTPNPPLTSPLAATPDRLLFQTWKPEYREALHRLFHEPAPSTHPLTATISVEHLFMPYDNYGDFLSLQFQKQAAPDLFFVRPYIDEKLFVQGNITELTDFPNLDQTYAAQDLAPWTTDAGQVYGIPLGSVVHGVFYNADLFAQQNVRPPQTWEELLDVAEQLQGAGILPFANSWANSDSELYDPVFINLVPNFTSGRAGRLAYEQGDRCLNDPNMVAAYQALAELSPYLDPEPRSQIESKQRFLSGQAAMLVSGSWQLVIFKSANPGFEWRVFPMPAPAGQQPGHTVFHPDFALALNANSPHPEAAKAWLAWFMSREGAEFVSNELIGNIISRREPVALSDPLAQQMFSFTQARPTDVRWTYPKLHSKIPAGTDLAKDGAKAVILGEMTPQEAADRLQDGVAQWYGPAQTCPQAGQLEKTQAVH